MCRTEVGRKQDLQRSPGATIRSEDFPNVVSLAPFNQRFPISEFLSPLTPWVAVISITGRLRAEGRQRRFPNRTQCPRAVESKLCPEAKDGGWADHGSSEVSVDVLRARSLFGRIHHSSCFHVPFLNSAQISWRVCRTQFRPFLCSARTPAPRSVRRTLVVSPALS